MSANQTKSLTLAERRTALREAAQNIDQIATYAAGEMEASAGSFAGELAVASAMNDLRLALTPEIMAPVMALMNTDLGFRTDRDPNQIDQKTQRPYIPYGLEVVRECFIESKLRGFHTVGNEWNIIAGRFYACKNGLRRKATTFPGLSEFRDTYAVPKLAGDKGAIVACEASWRIKGHADEIKAEIPIKVNSFMGADAILGKAERKLMKRVLDRLTGFSTPEGDALDIESHVVTSSPKQVAGPVDPATFEKPKLAASPILPNTQATTPPDNRDMATAANREPANPPGGGKDEPPTSAGRAPGTSDSVAIVTDELLKGGVTFDAFTEWLIQTERFMAADSLPSIESLPESVARELIADGCKSLKKCIALKGNASTLL